ncbi:MAG: hypothetical protein GYA57_04625 [Myxococcales bacterium]|nr:hypothetical protein [Myxococcales bacterium]
MNPRLPLLFAALAVLAALAAACGDNESSVGEICNNGIDDDRDGITDCFDPDCVGLPACIGGGETDCDNSLDDDHDGVADCDDPDCFYDLACAASAERDCADGLDDDGDGLTDCEDRDCASSPACRELDCANGVDDDGDGSTDCGDPDCAALPECGARVERDCANGVDDDGDGSTDCGDADCALAPACHELNCENGLDDERDGLTDCGDPDCARDPACLPEADCANGADDDGDGFTDCEDPDCASDAACRPEADCANGVDDDGDTLVDCDDSDCAIDPACAGECSDATDRFEDNDTRATAADGAAVLPTDALAVLPGDPDYFSIAVCPGAVVTATLDFVHALGDIDVTLETASGSRLAAATSGDDDETLTWTAGSLGTVYLHVYLWERDPSPCNRYTLTLTVDRTACPAGETNCANGLDEDGDGWTDCADVADCATDPVCSEEADCGDGLDDDGDGRTDCEDAACCDDPACVADPTCMAGANDTCATPYLLPDDPEGTWYGDTTGMAADYGSGSCGGGARGPDVVYRFALTERAQVTVDLSGSSYDTVAYLRGADCAAGAILACDDDSGSDYDSMFSLVLEPGTYHLFVDGFDTTSAGPFVLAIALGEPENCGDGLDNDGDGATDCADTECAGAPGCVETACADTVDDDRDGATDCADFDCAIDAACRPATCAEDAHEDNDDRATATPWTALTSTEYLAVLSGDDDYVAIPVCAGAVVDIVVGFVHAAGDIDLYLQSATGATIRTSGGATDREAIRWTSDRAGTVYLRVNLFGSSTTGCNTYRLAISVDDSACS